MWVNNANDPMKGGRHGYLRREPLSRDDARTEGSGADHDRHRDRAGDMSRLSALSLDGRITVEYELRLFR
jgi:hypothetical protein